MPELMWRHMEEGVGMIEEVGMQNGFINETREATCWLDSQRGPSTYCLYKSDNECTSEGHQNH